MTLDEFIAALEEAEQVVVTDTPTVMGAVVYPDTEQETARAMIVLHRRYVAWKPTTKLWKHEQDGTHPPVLLPIADFDEFWEKGTLASDTMQRVGEVVGRRGIKLVRKRVGTWQGV